MIRIAIAALLAATFAGGPAPAGPHEEAVFTLISERLALMKPVAEWKFANATAVEDRTREAIVLKKAVADAAEAGLDPATVRPFFRAQIEAAKVIQACWIDRWRTGRAAPAAEPPDLASGIRPKLVDIGSRLLAAIRESLASGARFGAAGAADFNAVAAPDCLDREHRGAIYVTLARIRLAE